MTVGHVPSARRLPLLAAARALHASGFPRTAALMARCAAALKPRELAALRQLCAWALESGDHGAAEDLCRRMHAIAPQEPGPLSDLAQLELLRGAVADALAHFRRHSDLVFGSGTVTQALHSRHLDPERAKSGQPYFRRLADVLVDTGFWTIIEGDSIYSDDTHGRSLHANPLIRGRVTPDGATVIATWAQPRQTVAEECIFVGGDANYSHWLFRNLLKLSTLARAGMLDAYPWLLNDDLRPYQRQYLELLEVGPERLVQVQRNTVVRCRGLVVPALLTDPRTIRAGVDWIRERLRDSMIAPEKAGRLIYVSRRDVRQRALLNEDELVAALAPLGFETVVPGELSVVEQIQAFSGARFIVGIHGAALTNIVFAPYDAAILVVTSAAIERMDNFRRIAAAMGQKMTTIVSDRFDADPHDMHADYRVDVAAIVRAARQMLG